MIYRFRLSIRIFKKIYADHELDPGETIKKYLIVQIIEQYTIKGWVMDEKHLEKIRETSLSEHRYYQKLTDIYNIAMEYDKNAKTTKDIFAKA